MLTISVIVPTYNGAHKLPAILTALKEQTRQPQEIIVIVDGSTDNTKEVLNGHLQILPSLKVVYQANKGRAVVRNNGAFQAIGDLLIFFDDDMKPAADCIEIHYQHHLKYENTVLTGAQVDVKGGEYGEIQNYKAWLSEKWTEPLVNWGEKPLSKEMIYLTAANFSIPRSLFFKIGGFNQQLTDGEDFDLAFRAFREGIPLFYDHKAFAWHYDIITLKKYIKRNRQYYAAGRKLIDLNPEVYGKHFENRTASFQGRKKMFFRLFCFSFWITSSEKQLWRFLPKRFRYRLYDWIITANSAYFPNLLLIK